MKKPTLILTAFVALAASAAADPTAAPLPFVGDRNFFCSGMLDSPTSVSIRENGDTRIAIHGKYGYTDTVYQGKYQSLMPVSDDTGKVFWYYRFQDGKLHELNAQQQPAAACESSENQ